MQEFTTISRSEIKKRNEEKRKSDFNEIYSLLDCENAKEQASRCVQCGNPFCHDICDLGNFIPFWLYGIANNDILSAFKLSNATNPFPEITGRICPQERLCEGACTLQDGFGAIMIGAIETFISEEGFKIGLKPDFTTKKVNKKVAIVGAGPAGISAATYLCRGGVDVEIFDENIRAGGLLTYGIPGFKLEKNIIKRRIELLQEAGIKFNLGKRVGSDIKFDTLLSKFDAIFLAFGAREARKANIVNENAKNCINALDFLIQIQKQNFGETSKKISLNNKIVLVIGGGDTAMDCLRSALRLGAKKSICLYRRSKKDMPGSKKEFLNAYEEGAEFIFNAAPKEVLINKNGEVLGILAQKTIINSNKVEIIQDSEFVIKADYVIFALGFAVKSEKFLLENSIKIDSNSKVVINNFFETSQTKIYAGGDCVRGSALVVTAASDGKKAAKEIIKNFNDKI